ncbi:cysteine desulfurase family protein [Paracoccaceae bacterium GXU_MW_L88]
MSRAYLDYNATTPLRPEAKAAMLSAMDVTGNPSSVHSEGRAVKGLMEDARRRIATALGADGADVVFTSGATEAAALALKGKGYTSTKAEHPCVWTWCEHLDAVGPDGQISDAVQVRQAVNSETGIVQTPREGLVFTDMVQAAGKLPVAFNWMGTEMACISAHKFGGPKGIGALILRQGTEVAAQLRGGGQEMGRRAGTENILGAVGMAAALDAAVRDLETGEPARLETLRDHLESRLKEIAPEIICVGKDQKRLPGTSMMITPGWVGETQVMQMDLAGYAISAGTACSSGKTQVSGTLNAMGFDEMQARSAIRVSIGWETTEDEIEGFITAWRQAYERFKSRRKKEVA